jgi:predicted RNA-binding protein YlqC (UPF0109 family)
MNDNTQEKSISESLRELLDCFLKMLLEPEKQKLVEVEIAVSGSQAIIKVMTTSDEVIRILVGRDGMYANSMRKLMYAAASKACVSVLIYFRHGSLKA